MNEKELLNRIQFLERMLQLVSERAEAGLAHAKMMEHSTATQADAHNLYRTAVHLEGDAKRIITEYNELIELYNRQFAVHNLLLPFS